MTKKVDLYSDYSRFTERILDEIRKETFGVDIGQNSWTTTEEYDRFIESLRLGADSHVLEVASGSGGPALYLSRATGCRVTGVDVDEGAVATASRMAASAGHDRVRFSVADANARLPFEDGTFDALICIDAVNHLPDRAGVLREWSRVLRPGGRAVFTDPIVITGPVSNDELALRSSIGFFLFVPPGVNERLIEEAGLRWVSQEDLTDAAARVASRWYEARAKRKAKLIPTEGAERFEGLQRFFESVHRLAKERRLSRIGYLVERPGS